MAVAAVGALLLGACGQAPAGVAATVNGVEITDEELQRFVAQEKASLEEQGISGTEQLASLREVQRSVLTNFVKLRLLQQEAAERGITVSDAEVEEMWQEEIAFAGSEEALFARLEEIGLTEERAREQLAVNRLTTLLQEEVRASIVVTDEELEALYEQRSAEWERRSTSHIQLATEAEAQLLVEELRANPALFEQRAEELSLDAQTGALGGVLGENPRGAFQEAAPNFEDAVWNNPVGSIVGPVETPFGFHIIRIDGEVLRTFEDEVDTLRQQLVGQRFPEVYGSFEAELFGGADVVIDGRYGEWDVTLAQVVFADAFAG